jgi:acyl-CoA synthetase (AMP-forming)/AMP-acid ligase II
LPPEELDAHADSVGRAMPNCEVFIVDPEGNPVTPGQIGELIVKGSNVMQGYWNDPDLTARTYKNGRYPGDRTLHSGDYFRCDPQERLYFVGRKDDMIKCRGERVSAKEVENEISSLEGVTEVAVIGEPDEILGQAVKAFIVKAPGFELTEKDVMKYCADRLEVFMTPKYVVFMDHLPKTPNGKIDKKQLKELSIYPANRSFAK